MICCRLGAVALAFGALTHVQAQDLGHPCEALRLPSPDLLLSACTIKKNGAFAVYVGPLPTTGNNNAFEQRTVSVMKSSVLADLLEAGGIDFKPNGRFYLQRTKLMPPPMDDAVIERGVDKKIDTYRKWKVFSETVFYPGPGGRPGFALRCSTALRIRAVGDSDAVGECYSFENKQKFLKILREY